VMSMAAPTACTMNSLTVLVNPMTPHGVDTTTITIFQNLNSTSMHCSATSNMTNSSCSDTTHMFSVSQGDALAYSFEETNDNPFNTITVILTCQ
jgi:hypothetical protein